MVLRRVRVGVVVVWVEGVLRRMFGLWMGRLLLRLLGGHCGEMHGFGRMSRIGRSGVSLVAGLGSRLDRCRRMAC